MLDAPTGTPVTIDVPEAGAKTTVNTDADGNAKFTVKSGWTEEQQACIYKHQLVMFAKIPQLRGTTPWVQLDFRSTTRNIPVLQDGYNRKRLPSEDGKKKQAFLLCKGIQR